MALQFGMACASVPKALIAAQTDSVSHMALRSVAQLFEFSAAPITGEVPSAGTCRRCLLCEQRYMLASYSMLTTRHDATCIHTPKNPRKATHTVQFTRAY